MNHSLIRIVKWFCRKLTFNELASAVVIFHEVLSNSRKDIPLKPDEKPPHYRQFRVDPVFPLPVSKNDSAANLVDWKNLKKEQELKSGKPIKPVASKNGKKVPAKCKCQNCNAPRNFLYLNNGKLHSQVKCKICGKTTSINTTKRKPKAKFLCPYCSCALFKWKQSKQSTTYKCPSYNCPHYLRNKMSLTDEEKAMRRQVR